MRSRLAQIDTTGTGIILKELIDNALDASEEAGLHPYIEVGIELYCGALRIRVRDSGPGMDIFTLKKVLDVDKYAGSKTFFRRPTRGAQGNALMTVFSIPLVLGGHVIISSKFGVYDIGLESDPISQDTHFLLNQISEAEHTGFSIEVGLPVEYWFEAEKERYQSILHGFAAFNPHASFSFEIFGEVWKSDARGEIRRYLQKEPIHWYSFDEFRELVYTYLREGIDPTVKEFLQRFRGVSRNTKINVRGHLSQASEEELRCVYEEVKKSTKPPNPQALGGIGRTCAFEFMKAVPGADLSTFKFKSTERVVISVDDKSTHLKETPYLIEAAAVELKEGGRQAYLGINNSPAHNPELLERILGFQYDINFRDPVLVFLHIISPGLEYQNYGKTEFEYSGALEGILEALERVLKEYLEKKRKVEDRLRREQEKEIKEAEKAMKKLAREEKEKRQQRIKEIFIATIDEALKLTSDNGRYTPPIRQVFYKHRPILQEHGAEIDYAYYERLFKEEEERRGVRLANREARGGIILPRSGEWVQIDTRFLNEFEPPEWEFNKVLYIEKRGFIDYLIQAEIHNRYDMVLVGGQGYSTWDNRALLAKIVEKVPSCKIFCLHDCDIDGIEIKNTLEREHYIDGTKIEVIDLGLIPKEAIERKLPRETQVRTKRPKKILSQLSEDERRFFNIRKGKGKSWLVDRVELNVFSPGEFIAWVGKKLRGFGVTEKVIPPGNLIRGHTDEILARKRSLEDIKISDPELDNLIIELKHLFFDFDGFKASIEREWNRTFRVDQEEAKMAVEKRLKTNPQNAGEMHLKKLSKKGLRRSRVSGELRLEILKCSTQTERYSVKWLAFSRVLLKSTKIEKITE
ncbi:MAG: ATP-binding region, ATPase-like domain protein [Candidatus Syntrophoarchaeum caldarius]|uniref:ATP-binding region, ATPase-like domain protein n=1 Tax=Candidatus Syntropharchaeum caldarium TaxID=1838285 RepID=A0A1F2PAH7_9EURY|nr:MAG: ATP-binding region, ATPase-like domain protein [Candidatus Syntrophoarchaeum caldarius]